MTNPPQPSPEATAPNWIAALAATSSILVGTLVLCGWLFDVPLLRDVVEGAVSMTVNTAVCFIFCGLAMGLLQRQGLLRSRLAKVCAVIVGGISLLTLTELLTGGSFDLGALILGKQSRSMAPTTAICFILTVTALWLRSRPPGNLSHPLVLYWLGTLTISIGLMTEFDHLAAFTMGSGWLNFDGMAIHTAAVFLMLGAALLSYGWEAGRRWPVGRRITVAFSAGLTLIVAVAAYSNQTTKNLVEAADRVKHSYEVLEKISEVRVSLEALQSGVRGFVITRNDSFLPLTEDAVPVMLQEVQELRNLTANRPVVQRRIDDLAKLIDQGLLETRKTIELRRSTDFTGAAAQLAIGEGRRLSQMIRLRLGELEADERTLLADRAAQSSAATGRAFSLLPVGTVLSLILLLSGVFRLSGEMAARQRAADALVLSGRRLNVALDAAEIAEWVFNPATLEITRSLKYDQIFGYDERVPDWSYALFLQHVHSDDRDHVDRVIQKSKAAGLGWTFECRIIRRDGGEGWISVVGSPLTDESGRVVETLGIVKDITERKKAEENLRESEEFNRNIIESSPDCMKVLSLEGELLSMLTDLDILGIETISQWLNTSWLEFWTGGDRRAAEVAVKSAAAGGRGRFVGFHAFGGEPRWWDVLISPLLDANGAPKSLIAVLRDVTALRESEMRYRTLFDSIEEGFCLIEMIFDEHGKAMDYRHIEVNPAFERQSSIKNVTGKRMREISPDLEEYWFEIYGNVALTGEPIRFVNEAKSLDGRWFDVYAFPFGDRDSHKVAIIFTDITERRRAELKLRKAHEELQAVLGSITDGLAVLDVNWCYTYFSEQAATIVDRRSEEMIGGYIWDLFPEPRGTFQDKYEQAVESGQPVHFEEYCPEPMNKWLELHCYPSDLGLSIYFRDITPRKQEEQVLAKNRELLAMAITAGQLGIWDWDVASGTMVWDDPCKAFAGLAPDAVMTPEVALGSIHPDDRGRVTASVVHALEMKEDNEMEYRTVWPDGTVRWVQSRGRCFEGPDGKVIRCTGTTMDITPRKLAEAALKKSEEVLALAVKAGQLGVWNWDQATRTLAWNERCNAMTGISCDAPMSHLAAMRTLHPADRARIFTEVQFALESKVIIELEFRTLWRDGTVRWLQARGRAFESEAGELLHIAGILQDVTERREIEETLRRTNTELETLVDERTEVIQVTMEKLLGEITERRRLEEEILEIGERERARIGQDLHDDLGQQLVGISILMEIISGRLSAENHPSAIEAERLKSFLADMISTTRNLARSLYPIELERDGLILSLQDLAHRTEAMAGITCTLTTDEAFHFDKATEIHLYRIAQESIGNALKHGGANRIAIDCKARDGVLTLTISDDGSGFIERRRMDGNGSASFPIPRPSHRCQNLRHPRRKWRLPGMLLARLRPGEGRATRSTVPPHDLDRNE